jgi:hypothetical protein
LAQTQDKQGMENLETISGTLKLLQPAAEMDRKACMAGNLNKPMVLVHDGLPFNLTASTG